MSDCPAQSFAGTDNASITVATAYSVPLRDLLQQVGVCEELQYIKKKKSSGKEARKKGVGVVGTNVRGRDRGHREKGAGRE